MRRLTRSNSFYQSIPKVELHRHLEGSLRLATLREVARLHGRGLPGTSELQTLVQVNEEEPYTFENFLSKFQTLRLFYRSPEIISRITQEAIADAVQDNVRYIELRFTPVALSRAEGFSLAEVMDWVIEGVNQSKRDHDVMVGLIASVNRHESPDLARKVIELAAERQAQGVVGIDLAGNEVAFSAGPFSELFLEARQAGLHLTVHAGEWAGAENVREAIEKLGAERIGHGVRVMEDPLVVDLARERRVVFEVCVTSNYQTGSVPELHAHPLLHMLAAGLNVSINTDDPSISQITLSDEYRLVCENLGLPVSVLKELVLSGARGAFLPEAKRIRLVSKFQKELSEALQ